MSDLSLYYKRPGVVKRYVITHVCASAGLRRLTFAQQGRFTYADEAAAEASLKECRAGLEHALKPSEFETLAVEPCPCWPGHHDPCVYYTDDEIDAEQSQRRFTIARGDNSNVMGSEISGDNVYIAAYPQPLKGQKHPRDLAAGESTRCEYNFSGSKGTYTVTRIA